MSKYTNQVLGLLRVIIYLVADAKLDRNIHSSCYEHVEYPA